MAKTTQRFHFDDLVLDSESETPLYRQLEEQIRDAIWSQRINTGERLPSTRLLAKQLGVGRNTVINAYDQLIAEGFLLARNGSGTRVSDAVPGDEPPQPNSRGQKTFEIRLSEKVRAIDQVLPWLHWDDEQGALPFRPHTPSSDAFPYKIWTRLTTTRQRQMPHKLLQNADSRGYRPLREAVAGHLGVARGVNCHSDQVMITAGAQQGIELLAKILIDPGDVVVMEEPGYTPAAISFELAGARIVRIAVDDEGLDIEELQQRVSAARLIYVTPNNHFPLGVTMSLQRRAALLQWAQECGAVIIEDDYNGEYRYTGRPLPALYSLAELGRVVYMGSFSKLLFPALRIGYMVVPEALIDHLAAARWLLDRHSPPLEQAVLTDFIDQGHFVRHLCRMRTLYADRQQALIRASAKYLKGILSVPTMPGGLHLIGWLAPDVSEERLLAAGVGENIELLPVSLFSTRQVSTAGIILGYAPFTEEQIETSCNRLAQAYWRAWRRA